MYVLFDLDGTLTDPGPGITNSVRYALEKFGIFPATREELYPYIGPPLLESFRKYNCFTPEQAQEALRQYRVYFADKGLFENEVYDGIPQMFANLTAAGAVVILATSKPEEYAGRILEHFGLDKYFAFIGGNTLNEDRPTKEAVITYIRERYPDMDESNTVMVGDREYDIRGAHACGLPAVGVLYGYGDREELERAGAETVVSTVAK